jgi:hypothetical protein
MRVLDHLTLALGCEMGDVEGSLGVRVRMALICGAAVWGVCEVEDGPPVTTRLPFAVHLTAYQ